MSFKRTTTKKIEKLESSVEGQQNPQTVEVLKRLDEENADLKKEIAALKKSKK